MIVGLLPTPTYSPYALFALLIDLKSCGTRIQLRWTTRRLSERGQPFLIWPYRHKDITHVVCYCSQPHLYSRIFLCYSRWQHKVLAEHFCDQN